MKPSACVCRAASFLWLIFICGVSACGENNPEALGGDSDESDLPSSGDEIVDDMPIVIPSESDLDAEWLAAVESDLPEIIDPNDEDFVENSSFTDTLFIRYNGDEVVLEGGISGVDAVQEGAHLTLTSTVKKVAYVVRGSSTNGSLKIYGSNKFLLQFEGVELTNPQGAALNIQCEKRNFLVLKEGSINRLTDGTVYAEAPNGEDQKGTLFSEGKLIIGGQGSLYVQGNHKHAICCDDYYMQRKGSIVVVTGAVKDGIHANDAVFIKGGKLHVTAAGDGLECEEGPVSIAGGVSYVQSTDDGVAASYEGDDADIDNSVMISAGKLSIVTSGEKGMGVKSRGGMEVSGGNVTVLARGAGAKGLSCDGNLTLRGGTLVLVVSGTPLYESQENDLSSAACIKCDGDMLIADASLTLSATGAGGKGVNCAGALTIEYGAEIVVSTTGKQYVYQRLDTSAKGIKSEGDLTINGGSLTVATTGGEGSEGIESKSTLTINGGEVAVTAYDDALNAATAIVLNGGSVYAYSSSNDAIDSNGTLAVTGGVVVAVGAGVPEGALDCDQNVFAITGGVLIGVGGSNSAPTQTRSTQVSLLYAGSGSANQKIALYREDVPLLVYQLPRAYSQMSLLLSTPDLITGDSFRLLSGGAISGDDSFYGYYADASYSGGSVLCEIASASIVNAIGSTNGGGGGVSPNRPGGR